MTTATHAATLDDLARVEGQAELIGGRIVPLMATGRKPNRIASRIFRSLDDHAEATGRGETYTDNMGFTVPELQSGRQSFSPDVSFYEGPFPANDMRFVVGPPTFAVEVRGEHDQGGAAEAEMRAKRDDYFEAGTLVVWDVDPIAETVTIYRADQPDQPDRRGKGEDWDAEPAVPGWRVSARQLFR